MDSLYESERLRLMEPHVADAHGLSNTIFDTGKAVQCFTLFVSIAFKIVEIAS